jgi:hypothetical protein
VIATLNKYATTHMKDISVVPKKKKKNEEY